MTRGAGWVPHLSVIMLATGPSRLHMEQEIPQGGHECHPNQDPNCNANTGPHREARGASSIAHSQPDGVTFAATDWVGDFTLIIPGMPHPDRAYGEGAVVRGQLHPLQEL